MWYIIKKRIQYRRVLNNIRLNIEELVFIPNKSNETTIDKKIRLSKIMNNIDRERRVNSLFNK